MTLTLSGNERQKKANCKNILDFCSFFFSFLSQYKYLFSFTFYKTKPDESWILLCIKCRTVKCTPFYNKHKKTNTKVYRLMHVRWNLANTYVDVESILDLNGKNVFICRHMLLFTCDQHVISMCCQNIVMSHLVLIDSVCVTLISPNSIA